MELLSENDSFANAALYYSESKTGFGTAPVSAYTELEPIGKFEGKNIFLIEISSKSAQYWKLCLTPEAGQQVSIAELCFTSDNGNFLSESTVTTDTSDGQAEKVKDHSVFSYWTVRDREKTLYIDLEQSQTINYIEIFENAESLANIQVFVGDLSDGEVS